MMVDDPKTHLNVGGSRGWTTACGIESSSFVDQNNGQDDEVDCKKCQKWIASQEQKK